MDVEISSKSISKVSQMDWVNSKDAHPFEMQSWQFWDAKWIHVVSYNFEYFLVWS